MQLNEDSFDILSFVARSSKFEPTKTFLVLRHRKLEKPNCLYGEIPASLQIGDLMPLQIISRSSGYLTPPELLSGLRNGGYLVRIYEDELKAKEHFNKTKQPIQAYLFKNGACLDLFDAPEEAPSMVIQEGVSSV